MYCRECGEKNPENAIYCKNCGIKLKEEAKKTTVIESENINHNSNYTYIPNNTQTTKSNNNSSDDDWKCCCGCLIVIFIIFALASLF